MYLDPGQEAHPMQEELVMKKRQLAATGKVKTLLLRLRASLLNKASHLQDVYTFTASVPVKSWTELLTQLRLPAKGDLTDELDSAINQVSSTQRIRSECLSETLS